MDYEKFFGDGSFSEFMVENIIKSQINGSGVLYDGGANEGRHTMVGLEAGGTVYAFEPIPEMVSKIREKAEPFYGAPERLKVFELALSNRPGTVEFTYCTSRPTLSGLHSRARLLDQETRVLSVRKVTIDDLVAEHSLMPPSVIKLDLEGGEHDALLGAERTLKHKPVIIFEHGGLEGSTLYEYSNKDYFRFFGERGYRLVQITGQDCLEVDFLRPRHWYFVALHKANPAHTELARIFDYLCADAAQRMLVEKGIRTDV